MSELSRFDLIAAEPAAREAVPFINSWAGSDRSTLFHGDAAADARTEKLIEQRTRKLEERLVREVPAAKPHLGRKPRQSETYIPPLPLEGLAKGKIYLVDTLEGLWRWQIAGRPVWFLQLWATEGNGGFGEGAMFLMEGDKLGASTAARTKGRIVDLDADAVGSLVRQLRGQRSPDAAETPSVSRPLSGERLRRRQLDRRL